MVSPNMFPGYSKGTSHYKWVKRIIEKARAANIPWVIVGMHKYCLVIGTQTCPGPDLINLLLSEKVDLILQAQKHDYQSSKQLALNSTTCPAMAITSYNPNCVVNDTTSLTRGAGTVIVVTGTGGTVPLLSISTTDPKIGYFRSWMGANVNPTWGVSRFTVAATQLTAQFVPVSGEPLAMALPSPAAPPLPLHRRVYRRHLLRRPEQYWRRTASSVLISPSGEQLPTDRSGQVMPTVSPTSPSAAIRGKL